MATAAKNFPWKLTFVQTWLQHFAIIRSWSNSVFLTKHSFKCLAGMLLMLILRMKHLLSCAHVCRQNRKLWIWKFHLAIWQTTSMKCTKVRAARAAPLFFLVLLLCVVVVAETPYNDCRLFWYTAPLHECIFFLPLHGLLYELILFGRNIDVSSS